MRYEWTDSGTLALRRRAVAKGGIFTDEECPAAEKFVAKKLAKRIEPPPATPSSVVKTVSPTAPRLPYLETPPEVETKSEPPPEIKIDVGIMEATLGAGVDGNFGTDDDTVEIKPKPKPVKTKAKKSKKKAKK